MGNTKIFKKISGDVIPPKTEKEPNNNLQFSDKFLAKIIVNDNECYSIISYDFKKQRWCSISTGLQKVVEYYVEDLAFEKRVNEIIKVDMDVLREMFNVMDVLCEMFNAMDEEDKNII